MTRFARATHVILVHDLAGFGKASGSTDALVLAHLLDDYYRLADGHVADGGGRVVKFMGDACLAIFPESGAEKAIAAAMAIREAVPAIAAEHGVAVGPGKANVHRAEIVEGAFGAAGAYDVVGPGVNHAFVLGGGLGPGVHVSDDALATLPAAARGQYAPSATAGVHTRR